MTTNNSREILKDDKRPQLFGWAPGGYFCKCSECGHSFAGDKRATTCADCAYDPTKWEATVLKLRCENLELTQRVKALELAVTPVKKLEGKYPVVLFFDNEAEGLAFAKLVQQAKGFTEHQL